MCIQPLRAPKDVYPEVWLLYACPHLHAHTHTYARSSICTRARTRTYAHTYIRTLKQTSRIETNLGQRTRNSTCKQKSESFDIVFSHFRSFITFSQLVFHIFPTCFLTFITFSQLVFSPLSHFPNLFSHLFHIFVPFLHFLTVWWTGGQHKQHRFVVSD